jgi:hypothetical protein
MALGRFLALLRVRVLARGRRATAAAAARGQQARSCTDARVRAIRAQGEVATSAAEARARAAIAGFLRAQRQAGTAAAVAGDRLRQASHIILFLFSTFMASGSYSSWPDDVLWLAGTRVRRRPRPRHPRAWGGGDQRRRCVRGGARPGRVRVPPPRPAAGGGGGPRDPACGRTVRARLLPARPAAGGGCISGGYVGGRARRDQPTLPRLWANWTAGTLLIPNGFLSWHESNRSLYLSLLA